jgi:hypothetical protein
MLPARKNFAVRDTFDDVMTTLTSCLAAFYDCAGVCETTVSMLLLVLPGIEYCLITTTAPDLPLSAEKTFVVQHVCRCSCSCSSY